jgi:hypothetical protein
VLRRPLLARAPRPRSPSAACGRVVHQSDCALGASGRSWCRRACLGSMVARPVVRSVPRGFGGADRLAAKGGLLPRRRILPSVVGAPCRRGGASACSLPSSVRGRNPVNWTRAPTDAPRSLVPGDEPVPPPADAQQPGPWPPRRWITGGRGPGLSGAVEPARRRARIDAAERQVLASIREHVHESVAHHAWRRECERVIAVRPESAAAAERTIDAERTADREAAHAATQRSGVACLGDEMQVVALHREVHDAKVRPGGGGQRSDDCPTRVPRAKPHHLGSRAQGDQRGMSRIERGSCAVRDRGAPTRSTLATGAPTSAAPSRSLRQAQWELTGPRSHLE